MPSQIWSRVYSRACRVCLNFCILLNFWCLLAGSASVSSGIFLPEPPFTARLGMAAVDAFCGPAFTVAAPSDGLRNLGRETTILGIFGLLPHVASEFVEAGDVQGGGDVRRIWHFCKVPLASTKV